MRYQGVKIWNKITVFKQQLQFCSLFAKMSRPGYSEMAIAIFESSCHVLLLTTNHSKVESCRKIWNDMYIEYTADWVENQSKTNHFY